MTVESVPGVKSVRSDVGQAPSVIPIVIVCAIGVLVSLMTFFPGWMSPDSMEQYRQAKGIWSFADWHPPLMAWWWRQVIWIYDGPAPMLMQNVLLYWGAWGLLAAGLRHGVGRAAYLVPLVGFWPGLLFPLGMIWKDIFFGTLVFAAWAILIHAHLSTRRPRWWQRLLVMVFAVLAVGAKPNGLVVLPFLFWYWLHVEGLLVRRFFAQAGLAGVATVVCVTTAQLPLMTVPVVPMSPFQYTQGYDLLGISVRTGEVLLPQYITDKVGDDLSTLAALYSPDSNDRLAFFEAGGTMTFDPAQLEDLASRWEKALITHPLVYLQHRWDHFWAMMRIWNGPAYVATPAIEPNEYGLSFMSNRFADRLASTPQRWPWMFVPWLYALLFLTAAAVLIVVRWRLPLALSLSASAVAFVAPHYFLLPAADFRYLYYAYLCAMAVGAIVLVEVLVPYIRARAQVAVVRQSPGGRDS